MTEGAATLDLAHPSPDPKPLARVYGEAVTELPHDLYIPPEALEVFLESFEGPLDLLLYLIRKQNINVLDIPMAELTQAVPGLRRDDAPHPARAGRRVSADGGGADRDQVAPAAAQATGAAGSGSRRIPRAELVRRLLEYERMKQAARAIDEHPLAERDFTTVRVWFERVAAARLPDVHPEDLRAAWIALIQRARVNRHHLVTREQLSVRSEMSRVLKMLEPARSLEFTALFAEHADVAHLVVTFLALLELAREQLVTIAQAEPYAPIHVQLKGAPAFALAGDDA